MEKVTFTDWDVKDHLKTPAEIEAYIRAATEEGTPDALPDAFSDIFRAQGREKEALVCAGLAEYLRATSQKKAKSSARRKRAQL
jgi:DNA-binding phage protein